MNNERTGTAQTIVVTVAAVLAAVLALAGCDHRSTGPHKAARGPLGYHTTDGAPLPVGGDGTDVGLPTGDGGDGGGGLPTGDGGDGGGGLPTGGDGGDQSAGPILSGQVIDINGVPEPKAAIEIHFVVSGDTYVTTDASGAYALPYSPDLSVGTVVCEPYDPDLVLKCTPVDVPTPVVFDPSQGPRVINWVVSKS